MTTAMPRGSVDGTADATPRRLLRLLAGAGIALVLVIVVASAYLRLSAAGLSCAHWSAGSSGPRATAPPASSARGESASSVAASEPGGQVAPQSGKVGHARPAKRALT